MRSLTFFGILLLLIYFFIKVRFIARMLIILSEDINEIKEKLGLAVYHLTREQTDENSMRSFIQKKVFEKMKNLDKKQKDQIGLFLRRQYAEWIAYCRINLI